MSVCSVPGCVCLSPGLRPTAPQRAGPAHRSREGPDPTGLWENKARSCLKTPRRCWDSEQPHPLPRRRMGGGLPTGHGLKGHVPCE